MTFEQSIVTCLRGYARFDGRARRSEFWWFQCFLMLLFTAAFIIGSLNEALGGLAFTAVALGLFVPNLAVSARRLHDGGWSGWWLLGALVPMGSMGLLLLFVLRGNEGENRFGPPEGTQRAQLIPFDALDASFEETRIPRVTQRRHDL